MVSELLAFLAGDWKGWELVGLEPMTSGFPDHPTTKRESK